VARRSLFPLASAAIYSPKKTSRPTQGDWASVPDDALVERFAGVTVWRASGKRAPHKPLLMLYALARVQRREPRLATFAEIEERVAAVPGLNI
jgi:hypothetical protein